jgi:hypothetical protein
MLYRTNERDRRKTNRLERLSELANRISDLIVESKLKDLAVNGDVDGDGASHVSRVAGSFQEM